jgi:subtilisin family serine protease
MRWRRSFALCIAVFLLSFIFLVFASGASILESFSDVQFLEGFEEDETSTEIIKTAGYLSGSESSHTFTSLSALDNISISGIVEGSYLVEFKKAPLIETFSEKEELVQDLEEQYAAAEPNSRQARSVQSKIERTERQQERAIAKSKNDLVQEHERALSDLSARLYDRTPPADWGVFSFALPLAEFVSRITGRAVDDGETPQLVPEKEYFTAFNGIALSGLTEEDIARLNQSRYVKRIVPNHYMQLLLDKSVPAIGADQVWMRDVEGRACGESGKPCVTGKGVRIGVIDSGIDYTHPDLGNGCFVPSRMGCIVDNKCDGKRFTVTEEKPLDFTFNKVDYKVSSSFISSTKVKLIVNGDTLNTLTRGDSIRLASKEYLTIDDILKRDVAGSIGRVDFTMGENDKTCPSDCKIPPAPPTTPSPPSPSPTPPKEPACHDSDQDATFPDGLNYYNKGIVKCGAKSYTDVCTDSANLLEYYYDAGIEDYNSVYYRCPNGCVDGACVASGSENKVTSITGAVISPQSNSQTTSSASVYLPLQKGSESDEAFAVFQQQHGDGWTLAVDHISARPAYLFGKSISGTTVGAERVNRENAASVGVRLLDADKNFFRIDTDVLRTISVTGDAGEGVQAIYQQTYKSIPVYNSFIVMGFKDDALTLYRANYFDVAGVNLNPSLSPGAAQRAAVARVNVAADAFVEPELVVYPQIRENSVTYTLAYVIDMIFSDEPVSSYRVAVDAHAGTIIDVEDRVAYEVSGSVSGKVFPEHSGEQPVEKAFAYERVSVGGKSEMTGTNGAYSVAVGAGSYELTSKLAGPWVKVDDAKNQNINNILQDTLVDSTEGYIYWTTVAGMIKRSKLDSSEVQTIVPKDGARLLALDTANKKIYWSEKYGSRLQRGDLDGKNAETVVTTIPEENLVGAALDTKNKKLYWSKRVYSEKAVPKTVIMRAEFDGTKAEQAFTIDESTYTLRIDGHAGKIYFSKESYKSREIFRANLDGTNKETVVKVITPYIVYFIVDSTNKRLYWIDDVSNDQMDRVIKRANLDGTNSEIIVSSKDYLSSIELDVEKKHLYWSTATGKLMRSDLDGKNAEKIVIQEGAGLVHRAAIIAPTTHSWNWEQDDTSSKDEQSNVFYHTNEIHKFFKSIGVSEIDREFSAFLNIPDPKGCNAYYVADSINFYQENARCENTALLSDVIYHEYAHGVVDHVITVPFPYKGETGNLNEAWVDYFAVSENGNSCIGEGFFKQGKKCLRDCKNTNIWPKDYADEPHTGSPIVCGALWDLREILGKQSTDKLAIAAIRLQPTTFEMFLNSMLIADDNNGNLDDGTPHRAAICKAFHDNHGIPSEQCENIGGRIPRLPQESSPEQCKIGGGWDFGDDDPDPMDKNGHGTHVAGIIAARPTNVLPAGAIAHFEFNESVLASVKGEVSDSAGQYRGTAYLGTTTEAGGIGGRKARFDGERAFIALDRVPVFGEGMSVSGWFNTTSFGNKENEITGSWLSGRDSFVLSPNKDGSVSFFVMVNGKWIAAQSPPGSIKLGEWEHWAGSYDGSMIRVFKNGVVLTETPASGVLGNAKKFCIGADCSTEAEWRADFCDSSGSVQEYYYDEGIDSYSSTLLQCPNNRMCNDGACVLTSATAALTVVVTVGSGTLDAANVELTRGNEKYTTAFNGRSAYFTDIPVGHYMLSVSADGYETATRSSVLVADRTNNEVVVRLRNKRSSAAPSLVTGAVTSPACTDSDQDATIPDGKNYFNKGTVKCGEESKTDTCIDSTNLQEYYYDEGIDSYNSVYYRCPNGCTNGACSSSTNACIDSDGGENVMVKGTITCGSESKTDVCYSSATVQEYYYDAGIESYGSHYLDCPTGTTCSDGACKKSGGSGGVQGSCYESDNGIDAVKKGTIVCGIGNRHFNGSVDEVLVYGRALSEKEIQRLYSLQLRSLNGELSTVRGKIGVAPDATLYALKVADSFGMITEEWLIAALEWSLDPNGDGKFDDRLDAVSISIGGFGDPDDALSQAVNAVVDSGVVAVVAAGNSGPGGNFYCRHESNGTTNSVCSPGTAERAITVGAMDNRKRIAEFSSRGPAAWEQGMLLKPDLLAPGVRVVSTIPGGNYMAASGTSMATPHITGIVALMKQVHPEWTPDDIKVALRSGSADLSLPWTDQGHGAAQAPEIVFREKDTFTLKAPRFGTGVAEIELALSDTIQAKALSLEYGKGLTPSEWTRVPLSAASQSSGSKGAIVKVDLSTFEMEEGEPYVLRAKTGLSENRFALVPNNLDTSSLPVSHVYAAGGLLPLSIGIHPAAEKHADVKGYVLEYRAMSDPYSKLSTTTDAPWSTQHMLACKPAKGAAYASAPRALCNDLKAQEQRFFLDTSFVKEPGFYEVQARLILKNREIVEKREMLLLDPGMRAGWPQAIDFGEGSAFGGDFVPLAADILGDEQKEIIVHRGRSGRSPISASSSYYSTIFVYHPNGSLAWATDIARDNSMKLSSSLSLPVIGDIAGSASDEIIVPSLHFTLTPQGEIVSFGKLYALDALGFGLSGWPIDIPPSLFPRIVIADLDRDLENEIILLTNGAGFFGKRDSLTIFKGGKLLKQWEIPQSYTIGSIHAPAIGNFDSDPELEIVIATTVKDTLGNSVNGTIVIYNADGSIVPGWPRILPAAVSTDHVPVVGDIDQNGRDDIIVGGSIKAGASSDGYETFNGVLYAFRDDGTLHPGYPVSLGGIKHDTYYGVPRDPWGSPALLNITGDAKLEIAFVSGGDYIDGYLVWLLYANGTSVTGWPQNVSIIRTSGISTSYGPTIADVSGDGVPDIMLASGNAFIIETYKEAGVEREVLRGGVYAWHANGSVIAGFPKATQFLAFAPPLVTDLEGDGRAELVASSMFDVDMARKKPLNRGTLYVWSLPGAALPEEDVWPTYRKDSMRSACTDCIAVAEFEVDKFKEKGTIIQSAKHSAAIIYHQLDAAEVQKQSALLIRSVLFRKDKVKILSEKMPLLNRPAQLYFEGVSQKKPLVLYNGAICTPEVCPVILYNNETKSLIVNVTKFSTFEIVEAPVCGDKVCAATLGESCSACAADCGACPAGTPPGGSGGQEQRRSGGGGDFVPCKSQWQCNFGQCVNGKQTTTCVDIKKCPIATDKPAPETKACSPTNRSDPVIRPKQPTPEQPAETPEGLPLWLWIVVIALVLGGLAVAIVLFVIRRRSGQIKPQQVQARISEGRAY